MEPTMIDKYEIATNFNTESEMILQGVEKAFLPFLEKKRALVSRRINACKGDKNFLELTKWLYVDLIDIETAIAQAGIRLARARGVEIEI